MDGLPQGTSDYDVFRMNVMANSSANSLLANGSNKGSGAERVAGPTTAS